MLLTRSEFENLEQQNKLRIAFVGMSNIGKSFRATQLQQVKGFYVHEVDTEIARKLGLEGVTDIASWMKHPDDVDYPKKQQYYLEVEGEVMKQDFESTENTIIDTTGSVIYLEQTILDDLKKNALVVEFRVPSSSLQMMINDFFANPKPVIWGDIFDQKEGESTVAALSRCYPRLLAERNQRYRAIADISLPDSLTRDEGVSIESFWEMLLSALPE